MALELKKISPVELRSLGLNEKWLQERIKEDTTILGLGELDMSCTRFRRHRVRCFMEQEVCHGETAVYPGVQA